MVDLDKLHTTLSALNESTSPTRAKATEFASWRDTKSGKQVTTMKLRGLQRSALGSFQATDALMMEALWNNREQIIEALDLAASLNRPIATKDTQSNVEIFLGRLADANPDVSPEDISRAIFGDPIEQHLTERNRADTLARTGVSRSR